MATSRRPGQLGRYTLGLSPLTPGPLGCNDAADPNARFRLLGESPLPGDAPGVLGCNDHATPGPGYSLGIALLELGEKGRKPPAPWQYDAANLLGDAKLCPAFVAKAHQALKAAVTAGLRPKVHEAYRSPEESDRKHKLWTQKKGGRAAAAWRSCHNYGLAMDVWLYDVKGHYIDNHVKGWYKLYKSMNKLAAGLVWGEGFGDGDADHWEYHPDWEGGADGSFLLKVRLWAMAAAAHLQETGTALSLPGGQCKEPTSDEWMPYVWWAAGAGGTAPPAAFLAKNPAPEQS